MTNEGKLLKYVKDLGTSLDAICASVKTLEKDKESVTIERDRFNEYLKQFYKYSLSNYNKLEVCQEKLKVYVEKYGELKPEEYGE